jgi:hypothetical protein
LLLFLLMSLLATAEIRQLASGRIPKRNREVMENPH